MHPYRPPEAKFIFTYPVGLLFQLDPLVALSNALASRALYRGLLWSLVAFIPTMFLGRFSCGWIRPLGSVHHFFSSLKSERKRGKQHLEPTRYKRWQTTKYYLLIVALVAAVMGTGIVGWVDPFSFLVRSLGREPIRLDACEGLLEHGDRCPAVFEMAANRRLGTYLFEKFARE